MSGGTIKQIADQATKAKRNRDDLNFLLQKFLQEARVLEDKQKILGAELNEVWRQVNLRSVYKKIIDSNN
ncbi:MAG: hypothetical protein HOA57_03670 [Candidatus Magasanikbacteria bacterium]|jgi:hypothetical protein|nr:hypothetical protein [Candidatus Magasanikbacteria bacterium]MBT4314570.1 hypothetical protein [Candidatus Magasanikbacteria bacterium]MBT4547468.1 hypothetical protein [Candidatus Magasanikbacteria bacterium]MBT6819450.1 hypothetical protein [Candidatus Magasanikbacteria bacterium]